MSSIKGQLISGTIWQSLGFFSELGIQFVVTIIIARILSPGDYGLIGLLTIFTAISTTITDSGFGAALIRKKDAVDLDYSSVFYLNFFIGITLYVVLYFLSPTIAEFYKVPELTKIARLVFLVIPINSIGLIQYTQLNKKMEFKKYAVISIISSVISGVIGVSLAKSGFNVYSLVFQILSFNTAKTILLVVFNKWIPGLTFSVNSIKNIIGFSVNLMSSNLIIVFFNNLYTILIGKYYSASQVGFYNQAKKFEEICGTSITSIILNVTYPALSKCQDDLPTLKRGYIKIIQLAIAIMAPLMLGLIGISNDLFELVLTKKWLPAVPYFEILCVYGLTIPLHQVNYNIFKVFGKSKMILRIEILRRLFLLLVIYYTLNISIEAMLWGQVLSVFLIIILAMYYSGKLIGYSMKDQIGDVYIYYIFAALGFSLLKYLQTLFTFTPAWGVIFGVFVMFVSYVVLGAIFKVPVYLEIIDIVKSRIGKNK